jgi:hypothetical protein
MTKQDSEVEVVDFNKEFGEEPVVIDAKVKPQQLSKVLEQIEPTGIGVKFEECIDKKITILSIKPFKGQYGAALYTRFADENGELYYTVIGAQVPARKLWAARDQLPVTCTVVKKPSATSEGYYDLE